MAANSRRGGWIRGGFGAGVGAALAMMLVMAVLRLTTNTVSIPELMEESLIKLTGGQIEAFFINLLGVGGKALLLVFIVEGTLLLGGLLGLAFSYLWPLRAAGMRWLSGLLYGLVIGLLLNAAFLPLVGQGFFGSTALQATAPPSIANALYGTDLAPFGLPVPLSMFVLSIVFGLTLAALLPWRAATQSTEYWVASTAAEGAALGRRDFVKAAGGGIVALLGGLALWAVIRAALEPPPQAGPQPVEGEPPGGGGGAASASPTPSAVAQAPAQASPEGTHVAETKPTPDMTEVPPTPPVPPGFEGVKPVLVPEITPTGSFYITTKNFLDPTVDGNSWRLEFRGLVDNPFSINLKDLMAIPPVERVQTLACISNPVGGPLIGNGRWKGVSFRDLLQRAKPKAGVVDVVVRAADGYSDSFPIDVALNNDCVLAYEMNGESLVQKHGYPARLLVPNIYGMKNCKWITQVELVNSDYFGYWESQGWSDTAHYQIISRIDYPDKDRIPAQPIYVGGVAFAGNRGIKKVEVSTDGGKTWNEASLRQPLGKNTWVQWTYPWKPTTGVYTLQVRATDGTGNLQTAKVQDTFPDGATGYHTKQVRVA